MTTEKHDPWALLREARDAVGYCPMTEMGMAAVAELSDRIDAALAAHDAVPLGEESDESKAVWRAYVNRELSEDEAKSAAIAAARGMK